MHSVEELLVLVSFAGIEETVAMDSAPQPKRIYAIVPLSYSAGTFQVVKKKVQKVPYQSVRAYFTDRQLIPKLNHRLRRRVLVPPCILGCNYSCKEA